MERMKSIELEGDQFYSKHCLGNMSPHSLLKLKLERAPHRHRRRTVIPRTEEVERNESYGTVYGSRTPYFDRIIQDPYGNTRWTYSLQVLVDATLVHRHKKCIRH